MDPHAARHFALAWLLAALAAGLFLPPAKAQPVLLANLYPPAPANAPPSVQCPPGALVTGAPTNGAGVILTAQVCEPDGDPFCVRWLVNQREIRCLTVLGASRAHCTNATFSHMYPPGTNTVTIQVLDDGPAPVTCTTTVTVLVDTNLSVVARPPSLPRPPSAGPRASAADPTRRSQPSATAAPLTVVQNLPVGVRVRPVAAPGAPPPAPR